MARRIQILFLLVLPVLFVTASMLNAGSAPKRVSLYIDGREQSVVSFEQSVGSLLDELDISLKKGDDLYPSGDTPLADEQIILLTKRSKKVALKRKKLDSNITYTFEEKQVSIPFQTVRQPGKWLARGRIRKISKGENGISLVRYKITKVKGKEIKRDIVAQKVITPVKNEVVMVGNGRAVFASRSRTPSYPVAQAPANGKAMNVTATGYWKWVTGTGITATGRKAGYGIVAVDPRVIPLGTKLYVPGYGYAVAADTGGAIKGNKIDLCFNTYAEAKRYGRRRLTVQVVR